MKLSHTALETYRSCPKKYYYKYRERLEADKTYSSLLFGKAADEAFNYILTCAKEKTKSENVVEFAIAIFNKKMNEWQGQNEFVYFKNETPQDIDFGALTDEEKQKTVWEHLVKVGHKIIELFVNEIVPQLGEIQDVQVEKLITNSNEDVLKIVIDFVTILPDGRKVVFDNKTTSSIKRNYPAGSVKKSKQLAMYTEYYPGYLSGYIAIEKSLNPLYNIFIDRIEPEFKENVFKEIETNCNEIKSENFEKNEKSCYAFGRSCEYYSYCKFGNRTGLKVKE